MRLLRVEDDGSLRFEEFEDDKIPPFAILSHTWSQEKEKKEITFAAFMSGAYQDERDSACYKDSYEKIRRCGDQARKDGLRYIWVDTCCINKDSSAELSEAINSMYAWYRHADTCYAYLDDVDYVEGMGQSRWFKRGWTLQELLAPADVLFFDASWTPIGFKTSLTTKLSLYTSIDPKALQDGNNLSIFSIAERMSWAANRKTTRVEDEAYCLLGLFDVNMPLIYGEGRKAFVRLQEEILAKSEDASIFAYLSLRPPSPKEYAIMHSDIGIDIVLSEMVEVDQDMDEELVAGTTGLFASSPSYFGNGALYVPYRIVFDTPHLRLQTRKLGNIVQLPVVLWRSPLRELADVLHNGTVSQSQADIYSKYGIKFTTTSLKKLRQCYRPESSRDWDIAFVSSRRRDGGGVVGMLLHRDSGQDGVYVRQHFPSLVETTSIRTFMSRTIGECHNIEIEASTLRTGQGIAASSSRISKFLGDARIKTVIRATNLREYGLMDREYGLVERKNRTATTKALVTLIGKQFWSSSDLSIPIVEIAEPERNSAYGEDGAVCTIYLNYMMVDNFFDVRGRAPAASAFIPTTRGASVDVRLNEGLWLVVKSQIQWERQELLHHVDQLDKRCLLSLRVVTQAEHETLVQLQRGPLLDTLPKVSSLHAGLS